MKICVLSMQAVQNIGSLLQSYALKKSIESIGYVVSFLPIESRKNDNDLMEGKVDSFDGEHQGYGILSKLKKIDKYVFNRIKNSSIRKTQFEIYDAFREKYLYSVNALNVTEKVDERFDYCVIGSDEVFNCMTKSSWGFTSQLFGDVENAEQIITYAASCGSTVAKNLPIAVKKRICEAMRRLEAISVRDENTFDFVRDVAGRNSVIHLDPVLIGNFDKEINTVDRVKDLPERYCVIYSYDNRIHEKNEIRAVLEFCHNHRLTPIAVSMPQFWVKDYIVADPFQCLAIFKGADFVITDTFHGTIFSAKYSPRFATVIRESNRNKLQDLITRIRVSEHQVSGITLAELERVYENIHDKKKFEALIDLERVHSLSYLRDNLK